jgi:hypothetical protein
MHTGTYESVRAGRPSSVRVSSLTLNSISTLRFLPGVTRAFVKKTCSKSKVHV